MINPDTSFIKKIESRLKFIYKDKLDKTILADLLHVISSYQISSSKGAKWNEKDVVLITYGDSIKNAEEEPLQTLRTFLNDNLNEQLTVVHILPFFPYSSDDGFSVIDFREVNPELGDWRDIEDLTKDYDLMADLVINHASSKSQWFKNFLKQHGKGKNYFITEDPATDLSQVTRPRSTPLLTPYETADGTKHVWTTFSADQVDLNFSNPDLLVEMMDILLGYINKGARIIRLDAIAFLWKVVGTTCLHLPETHEVVKLMRDVAEFINPDTVILTETNVPNKENLSYFGDGDEAHMVYQFSLPPLLLHALHTGNSSYLTSWAKSLPQLEGNKTFFNFTASHDGVGVRPLEGLLPDDEKNTLVENMKGFGGLVNYKSNPDGSQSPYELNITYFDALKGTHKGEDSLHAERFLASQVCMMSLAGVPAFYIHSLTATPNYYEGVEKTQHNRTINRRKWQLDELKEVLKNDTTQKKVFESLQQLILLRKKQTAFHPNAAQEVLDFGNDFFVLKRQSQEQSILAIINLCDEEKEIEIPKGYGFDLISGDKFTSNKLNAYQCLWLVKR
ncbi:sugar phosphorylase [Draconibacterium sp. IB214405]|uniref:sugar phosphorylase n=1 Tax=Draconibacterium sp. IB214405 TaxID=3097352 RepID=UPI002A0B6B00|nr:sugar phosphorylase [Draconibacterium sp. IB214405]MDX8339471.1 sugar phosphorylase [Draconibacterium sp. IB214405]